MVGPSLPRVSSGECISQDDRHDEKVRLQLQGRSTTYHPWQQQAKNYQGGDPRKSIGQRGARGVDHGLGGTTDVMGRMNLPSLARSSGQPPQHNLDCFLDVTAPVVKTQTLRKSDFPESLRKTSCNPEENRFFNMGDVWDSFDEWSAYGAGVHLMLNGGERVVQYYVPYLSALQLYMEHQPHSQVCFRGRGGSESDTGSESCSDGESEKSFLDWKGAESPPPHLGGSSGNSSMLERKVEEKRVVLSYFEECPPYCRVPLVDKIADLSRVFDDDPAWEKIKPLRTLRSYDLSPNSWFSVAWYPIYRIPTGPTLRDLAACFLTFHSLSTPLPTGDDSWMQSNASDVGAPRTRCPLDRQPLKAFGLASYKLRGTVWSSNPEKRLTSKLEQSAYEHLTNLGVRHPDYEYFTSHTAPIRR